MRVGQQSSSSVASVNGVGEGGEGSVSSGVGDGEAEGGSVSVHERDTDLEEENKVTQFSNGCGCSLKCSFHFSLEHIRLMRANVAQLDRLALDMTIMGQIMAFTNCSQTSLHSTKHRHQLKEREKYRTVFYHQGLRVCKKTFLFLWRVSLQGTKDPLSH